MGGRIWGRGIGFAYRVDDKGKTVVRGGFGVLYSPQMPGMVRQAVAHPIIPFRVSWSLDEARALGLKFPVYTDDMAALSNARSALLGAISVFGDQSRLAKPVRHALPVQRSARS